MSVSGNTHGNNCSGSRKVSVPVQFFLFPSPPPPPPPVQAGVAWAAKPKNSPRWVRCLKVRQRARGFWAQGSSNGKKA